MNKGKFKSFISGFLCATLILSATITGFAATGTKTIQAAYNNIKIYVDNKLITPKDANGNTVEPFIYNGTTYLPVRAVGEALGKEVSWDGKTKSVYIGVQPNATNQNAEGETLAQKNAVRSAKSYLDFSGFSREGLIEQLEYEGYSHDDCVYAVDNCGADWYAEAVETAESYLDFTAFSREGLYDQLEYEGFTADQIEHALNAVGY